MNIKRRMIVVLLMTAGLAATGFIAPAADDWSIFQIQSYQVYEISAKTPGYENTSAWISLYWSRAEKAKLWFTIGDAAPTLPNSGPKPGLPFYYVRFRGTQLSHIVDLLRNEKPVYLHWNSSSLGAFIATGTETVGEGEK